MAKARILLSSDYTYGPPISLHDKKLWIEGQVKAAQDSFAASGVVCEVAVPGMEKDELGEYKFGEDNWNKISGYEFLSGMERGGLLTRNEDGQLTLDKGREDVMSKLHPDTHVDFVRFFPEGSSEFDASEFSKYYEETSHQRVGNLVSCVNSPDCSIVFNMGGGSLATYDLLPKLIAYEGPIEDNPTTFIGFSDGTTLPFYLMTRLEKINLVQASGLYDPGYLVGGEERPIKLVPLGERRAESDISAPLVPIGVHTVDHQFNKLECVKADYFHNKVVALESTNDPEYREKIGAMIEKRVFSSCQALIMGEFSLALLGEFSDAMQDAKLDGSSTKEDQIKIIVDKMGIIESQREALCKSLSQNYDILFGPDQAASYQFQISLLPMLKQSLFAGIAADLESAGCHMPIYKEEAGQSAVFGHGCRRGAYISSSTCVITSDGTFTSLNPIPKAVAMEAPAPSATMEPLRFVDQLAKSPEVATSR